MFEDDDMRLVFFQDFGEPILFTPNAADPFTITGIFDQRPLGPRSLKGAQVGFDDGAMVTGNGPELRCLTSDIEGKVSAGRCTATIRGRVYNVFDIRHDHLGTTLLILKVA
jgi:hypothetical protein